MLKYFMTIIKQNIHTKLEMSPMCFFVIFVPLDIVWPKKFVQVFM